MADALRDILVTQPAIPRAQDAIATEYLTSLALAPRSSLDTSEPQRLARDAHSTLASVQALSNRNREVLVTSAASHTSLRHSLPRITSRSSDLRNGVSRLEQEAASFASSFSRAGGGEGLAGRKESLVLLRNVERSVDMMELPALLASALSASPPNFASALDLYAQVKRLQSLYPESPLATDLFRQADQAILQMASDLLLSLRAPAIKLAANLRLISWLRRILPDIEPCAGDGRLSRDDCLSAVFLVSRLETLLNTLGALAPLRDLADGEKARSRTGENSQAWSSGQQTERYLKRYIEIFREQTFAIVSTYRATFTVGAEPSPSKPPHVGSPNDQLGPLPPALGDFSLELAELLLETLRDYLPTVGDQGSRDSILTQALYCAASLGRLGGDFGILLACSGSDVFNLSHITEWVEILRRHRLLAGRLESVIGLAKP